MREESMLHKLKLFALSMAAALLWFGGALAQTNELVVALPVDIPIPDTHKATGLPAIGADAQVSDVLVVIQNGEVVPWLAESWEYENGGRTLVFKIREGVKHHNEMPLTAEDVKWSIDRFREKSIGRSALAPVTEVSVVDELHVAVSTAEPFAPLLRTFSYATIGIYSKGAHDEVGDDEAFSRHPVGPGPFVFVEWIPGQRMRLRAFEDYWAGRPQVDILEFRTILDEASRIAALEAGEVDVIHAFSPTELERLEGNSEIAIYNPPSAGFIRLNMNTQRPPFDDPRVRQAVAYAINRVEIAEGLFLGQAPLAKSLVPSEAVGYTDEFDVYDYDPDRSRELLREAGVSNLSFELAFGSGRYLLDSEVATLVQAQLAQAGIRVNIVPMEWAQFSEYIRQPVDESKTNMTLTWWRTVNGDPDSAIGIFTQREVPPAGNNVPYYVSEEFERLYQAQQVETDDQERLGQIRELQRVLMEDLPAIPMYNQPQLWAARANVVGFQEAITPLSTMQPLHQVHFGD
jgi:peptide/nickel transport system substrate-binding protein